MTSFVSPDFPSAHGGLIRMANGLDSAQSLISKVNSAKGMAGALVVGGLAAAIVVAEQVVSAWADRHLLLAWIALWAIVFALLTVFSGVIRNWSGQLRADLQTRLAARREAASDRRTWSAALGDPRLMAELDIAHLRAEQDAIDRGVELPQRPFAKPAALHLPIWPRI